MIRLQTAGLALLVALALPASAEQSASQKGCIDVQVGQARALAYDCLTRQLQGSDLRARKGLQQQLDPQLQLQRKAPNQVGLATPAATSTRMGSSFGSSVVPQRP